MGTAYERPYRHPVAAATSRLFRLDPPLDCSPSGEQMTDYIVIREYMPSGYDPTRAVYVSDERGRVDRWDDVLSSLAVDPGVDAEQTLARLGYDRIHTEYFESAEDEDVSAAQTAAPAQTVRDLSGKSLGSIVVFEFKLPVSWIAAEITGRLRGVHHSARSTVLTLTSHISSTTNPQEFEVPSDTLVRVLS